MVFLAAANSQISNKPLFFVMDFQIIQQLLDGLVESPLAKTMRLCSVHAAGLF